MHAESNLPSRNSGLNPAKASIQHEQRAPAGATTAGEIEGPKFRAREHVPSLPCNVNYSHERELELYKELKS